MIQLNDDPSERTCINLKHELRLCIGILGYADIMFDGLRVPKQREGYSIAVTVNKVDTLAEQPIVWANAAQDRSKPEVGEESATQS